MGQKVHELSFSIRKMKVEDLRAVSHIHKIAWKEDHFSSKLNKKLLVSYYAYLLNDNKYCYVANDNQNRILGFVAGGENTGKSIKKFIQDFTIEIIVVLIRNPQFILSKLMNLLKNGNKAFIPPSKAKIRLISIAVDPLCNQKGIGEGLITYFENEVRKDNIGMVGLSVKKSNTKAINLYFKLGWEIERDEKSAYYLLKLL